MGRNENVAIRAESIWDNYVKLTKHWKTLPKTKQPDNNSFRTLQEAVDDPAVPAIFEQQYERKQGDISFL